MQKSSSHRLIPGRDFFLGFATLLLPVSLRLVVNRKGRAQRWVALQRKLQKTRPQPWHGAQTSPT